MENSRYTDVTLEVFETLWQQEYRNIGLALQSALHRTEQDVQRMIELGARVRLVKGAYKEPPAVAFQQKADVDEAFRRLMRLLLDAGRYPAIATHDEAMIADTRAFRDRAEHRPRSVRIPDAVRNPPRPAGRAGGRWATACAFICPSGSNGFPISCADLASGRPTSAFVLRALLRER